MATMPTHLRGIYDLLDSSDVELHLEQVVNVSWYLHSQTLLLVLLLDWRPAHFLRYFFSLQDEVSSATVAPLLRPDAPP